MDLLAISLVFVVCYNLLIHDKVLGNLNLTEKEDFIIERQLLHLNKPAVKTIVINYGDIYDCVEFYKQPAFDHPVLKNHTFNKTSEQKPSSIDIPFSEKETCPLGSVPIRRITKDDLIREKHALERRRLHPTNRPGTYLAIGRTKGDQIKYTGGACFITIHNPKTASHQFSTTRIKLQNGPDSIEAGWRVDPALYGDDKTRFFVRTDVGMSHCFNTRCPGFVHTNRYFPVDTVFNNVSMPGGPKYEQIYRIMRDNESGNWNLITGNIWNEVIIGYWPSGIFTRMKEWANYIEWGAAAYSPSGSPFPQMGTGNFPIVFHSDYDSYCAKMKVINDGGQIFRDADIETYATNSSLYSVVPYHSHLSHWARMIFYGGPGHWKI